MRYFTAERWLRLQDGAASPDETCRALEEWELVLAEYRLAVKTQLQDAPRDLYEFATSVCLHDAKLLGSWLDGSRSLYLLLQPEAPQQGPILVIYRQLVGLPQVFDSGIPQRYHTPQPTWMYDEVEPESTTEMRKYPIYQQRILFSNGWEVCLRFRSFSYSLPCLASLFPTRGQQQQNVFPLSA
jgi:hypothetical protein